MGTVQGVADSNCSSGAAEREDLRRGRHGAADSGCNRGRYGSTTTRLPNLPNFSQGLNQEHSSLFVSASNLRMMARSHRRSLSSTGHYAAGCVTVTLLGALSLILLRSPAAEKRCDLSFYDPASTEALDLGELRLRLSRAPAWFEKLFERGYRGRHWSFSANLTTTVSITPLKPSHRRGSLSISLPHKLRNRRVLASAAML